jgi:hypothetical protein
MEAFASRRYLRNKIRLEYVDDAERPRIYCDEPAVLARFASHVRQAAGRRWPDSPVLLRGQTANYPGMMPGLFRGGGVRKDLLEAEQQFERHVRDKIPLKRLKRADLGALLQHYGYATSWLDVVDNLWVAAWFASHRLLPVTRGHRRPEFQEGKTGWIYFLCPGAASPAGTCIDIRAAHHGLSIRPMTQHAWSIRGRSHSLDDLNRYVIATAEFPVAEPWRLESYLGSAAFLFPPADLDDTLRKLDKHGADEIARGVESDRTLVPDTLGYLYTVREGV